MMLPDLFFGAGAGRCGTMTIANLLNAEAGVMCTHEGKFRDIDVPGRQVLPFLTLQNGAAYREPEQAQALFEKYRSEMADVASREPHPPKMFGDVAYNYAPFIRAIAATYPDAKVFAIVRSGVAFVQSASAASGDDETPVGWAPTSRKLDRVEEFVALGRWRPRPDAPWADEWETEFDAFEKNAWLWAETNRVMLDALETVAPGNALLLRFEDLFRDLPAGYRQLRGFLGLEGEPSAEVEQLMVKPPINRRNANRMPPPDQWSKSQLTSFRLIAGGVMERLNYDLPGNHS